MCDYGGCDKPSTVLIEPGVYLCSVHGLRHTVGRLVCIYCAVPIVSREDTSAKKGDHKPGCPRAKSKVTAGDPR